MDMVGVDNSWLRLRAIHQMVEIEMEELGNPVMPKWPMRIVAQRLAVTTMDLNRYCWCCYRDGGAEAGYGCLLE